MPDSKVVSLSGTPIHRYVGMSDLSIALPEKFNEKGVNDIVDPKRRDVTRKRFALS